MRLFHRKPANKPISDVPPEVAVVADIDVLKLKLGTLDARLAVLEARFADADEAAIVLPDQGDVLDAQVRSARLSAELHLIAIELRAELQRLRAESPSEHVAGLAGLAGHLAEITADA